MLSKQISVFMENREGRLGEVLGVLKNNNVNILSLSLADTSDYGLLRIIVDKPESGAESLAKCGFPAKVSEILIVEISHKPGSLQRLIEELANNNVNIEYMYGLSVQGEEAKVIIKCNDLKKAEEIIAKHD